MYHYTDSGLSNVHLRGGYTELETEHGQAVSIQNLEGLHRVIGLDIVHNTPALSGEEIRFLRKEMDLTQNSLADIIGVTEDSVRGWEKRNQISPPADKLIRGLYLQHVDGNGSLRGLIEEISLLDRNIAENRRMNFEENENVWQAIA